MPGKHTDKQKRQAKHIEKSYEDKGNNPKEAESIAWATVNALKKGSTQKKKMC